ncbi:MAG: hypothetical protein AAGA11_18430 [Pseudomonadota bacterium]
MSVNAGVFASEPTPDASRITGADIDALLSGRTAIGEWGDDTYRQYFDPSGTTFYAPKGKRTTRGSWRVSESGSHYESWWSGSDDNWEAYEIIRVSDGLAWRDPKGQLYPFAMLDGQQLVWPD